MSIIDGIVNSINGDGRNFIAALKKVLLRIQQESIDKVNDLETKITTCEDVNGVGAMELHATDNNGMPRNDLRVDYDASNVNDFAYAKVWVKDGVNEGFKAIGSSKDGQYDVTDVIKGHTYFIRVTAVNNTGGESSLETAKEVSWTVQGSQLIPATPTQFFLDWDKDGAHWHWDAVDSPYLDFYELRLDGQAGVWNENRLDSTRNNTSNVTPHTRAGTAYLFVRNIFGTYSKPAVHAFNKVVPSKPNAPTFVKVFGGVQIHMDTLPSNYSQYVIEVIGTSEQNTYTSDLNDFVYFQVSGKLKVRYAFKDDLGQGEWSDYTEDDIREIELSDIPMIDGTKISDNAITADKIASNAITSAKIQANAITANKIEAGAITADKIGAKAITADKLAAGSVTADAIQAGSVVGDKISAGAITASHLAAENIDLIGALAIVGGAVRLNEEGLKVVNSTSDAYTLFNGDGVNYVDTYGEKFASIGRYIVGIANDGDYIRFKKPWNIIPSVFISPVSLQSMITGYSDTNLFLNYSATEISKNGFRVNAFTTLEAGTNYNQIYNAYIASIYFNNTTNSEKIIVLNAGVTNFTINGTFESGGYVKSHSSKDSGVSYTHYYATGIFEVYINGTMKKSETIYSSNTTTRAISWDFNIKEGDVVSVKLSYVYSSGSYQSSAYGARFYCSNIIQNVEGTTRISSGSAMFIATDGSTPAYTVEA